MAHTCTCSFSRYYRFIHGVMYYTYDVMYGKILCGVNNIVVKSDTLNKHLFAFVLIHFLLFIHVYV